MSTSVPTGPLLFTEPEIQQHARAIVAVTCPELLISEGEGTLRSNVVKHIGGGGGSLGNQQFAFDYAYGPWITNEAIYGDLVRPLLPKLLDGVNCSVFAGGSNWTGPYTLLDTANGTGPYTPSDTGNRTGLIPLAMRDLFGYLERVRDEFEFQLEISYFEVSDGQIRDLLNYTGEGLQVRESHGGVMDICNLSYYRPSHPYYLNQILEQGDSRRSRYSPRDSGDDGSALPNSHVIFQAQIQLHHRHALYNNMDLPYRSAKLVMVDLAKPDGTSSQMDSLLVLGNCLSSVALGRASTPFADSILTMVLKDSFRLDCRTVLISNAGEAATPLKWFPTEIWGIILSYVEDLSDVSNLSRTCWDLHTIVKKTLNPIRKVLRHVIPYLAKCDILTTRQVSRGICYSVDKFLAEHPYTNIEGGKLCVPWNKAKKLFRLVGSSSFYIKRSPFIARTIKLSTADSRELESSLNPYIKDYVWNIYLRSRGDKHSCCSICDSGVLNETFSKIFGLSWPIKSIRVEGAIDCDLPDVGYKSNPEFQFPRLRHSGPISIVFVTRQESGNTTGYRSLNTLLFGSYHSQLAHSEIDLMYLPLPDTSVPLYPCHYLTSLKITGVDDDMLLGCLERIEAPQLEELTLARPWNWGEYGIGRCASPFPTLTFYEKLSITGLSRALQRFPKTRSLKLHNNEFVIILELDGCDWDPLAGTCVPNQNPGHGEEGGKVEHDQAYHLRRIWRMLPPTVKELHLNWMWYSRNEIVEEYFETNTSTVGHIFRRN